MASCSQVANSFFHPQRQTRDGGDPTRCAEFMIGGLQGQMPAADFDFRRNQIREEMVGVADLLRRE